MPRLRLVHLEKFVVYPNGQRFLVTFCGRQQKPGQVFTGRLQEVTCRTCQAILFR